ncbi:MAG: Pycsar system effector family protein [Saprospiraceae bacterium]
MSKDKTKSTPSITKQAKKFLKKYFKQNFPLSYKFHNYSYIKEVVKTSKKIAQEMEASEENIEILRLAAWFYLSGKAINYDDYHEASVALAASFLEDRKYPKEKIDKVAALIRGTKSDSPMTGKLIDILRDASIAYTGSKDFKRSSTLLRVELEEQYHKIIKNKVWAQQQYDFLTGISFRTSYANDKYQYRLADNIDSQRKRIAKANTASIKKKTGKNFGRGIDTLYRTSYRNHINLSSIADGKANMMISVNTIIISAIVTLLGASFTMNETIGFMHNRFLVPIVILLVFVLGSAIFAIISARPEVTKGSITTEDIVKRKKSILFFGNFITIPKDDFIDNLDMLKRNQSLLYDNMSIDMYYLGHVLDRKYRLIKYSYNIFMVGLIAAVLSFIIVLFYTQVGVVS